MMLSIVLESLRTMRRTAVSHPSYPFKVMGHVVKGRIQLRRTNAKCSRYVMEKSKASHVQVLCPLMIGWLIPLGEGLVLD